MSSDQLAFSLEVAGKAALYASLLPAIGVCAIRSLLLPRLGLSSRDVGRINSALARAGTLAATLVVVALACRLVTHTIAVFGIPDALSISQIRIMALESRWSGGWRVQVVAASAFLAASVLVLVRPGTSSLLPGLACVALCYSVPLVGHAAGSPWRVLLHGSHVLGAGTWLGTLTVVLFMRLPHGSAQIAVGADSGEILRRALLRGFAPVALAGAAALVLTGAATALLYVGSLSNLWTASYGQLLDLKVVLLCGAAGCGFVNWRRFAAERTTGPLRDSSPSAVIILEVLFAAAVVLVTAVLTETGHP